MTNTSLPPHLERVGRQLTAAAYDLAPTPRPSRRRGFRFVAAGSAGLAAIAAASVLALGATTATSPAFAVTRLHNGSVSLKINRKTSLADVNRKLAAMGIKKIGKAEWTGTRAATADDGSASIPNCSSVPPGWKGQWEQMTGSISGPGYSIYESVTPGTWVLVYCYTGNPGSAGAVNTADTGSS